LVRGAAPHRVLPTSPVCTQDSGAFCRTDQSTDRGIAVVWLPDRGAPAGVQQEHGAADLPAEGLAGSRPIGFRPRVQAMPSVATAPNERRSTDMCRVWASHDVGLEDMWRSSIDFRKFNQIASVWGETQQMEPVPTRGSYPIYLPFSTRFNHKSSQVVPNSRRPPVPREPARRPVPKRREFSSPTAWIFETASSPFHAASVKRVAAMVVGLSWSRE